VDRLSYKILARICCQLHSLYSKRSTDLLSNLVFFVDVLALEIEMSEIDGAVEESADPYVETGRHDSRNKRVDKVARHDRSDVRCLGQLRLQQD